MEGPGFRVGDFELHPGIGTEIGWDSNVFFTDNGNPIPGRFQDSAIFRATASLMLATRGIQRREEGEAGGEGDPAPNPDLSFRGGAWASFFHLFNDNDRTNVSFGGSLNLGILTGRPFSVRITNDLNRAARPFTENAPGVGYGRLQNTAGVDFSFATTGEVLKFTLGYRNNLFFFEDAGFESNNRFRHGFILEESFRVLPETGIFHRTAVEVVDYFGGAPVAGASPVNDAVTVATEVGINGALTPELSLTALGGYSAGFFNAPDPTMYQQDYEGPNGRVELQWTPEERISLVVGGSTSYQPAFIGNFENRWSVYSSFQALIGGVFLLGLDAAFSYHIFGVVIDTSGALLGTTDTREDPRLVTSLFAEYRFSEWLGVNGTLAYLGNFTNYEFISPIGTMGATIIEPARYDKFEAFLGVRAFY